QNSRRQSIRVVAAKLHSTSPSRTRAGLSTRGRARAKAGRRTRLRRASLTEPSTRGVLASRGRRARKRPPDSESAIGCGGSGPSPGSVRKSRAVVCSRSPAGQRLLPHPRPSPAVFYSSLREISDCCEKGAEHVDSYPNRRQLARGWNHWTLP